MNEKMKNSKKVKHRPRFCRASFLSPKFSPVPVFFFSRMSDVVEVYISPNPKAIGLFGAAAVMPRAKGFAQSIHQLGRSNSIHRRIYHSWPGIELSHN